MKPITTTSIIAVAGLALCLALACSAKPAEVYAPADYRTWARTTNLVLDYPIPGHMDRLRIPRINALGLAAKPVREGNKLRWDFPEDTVIVKEVYASKKPAAGEGPIQLTIMAKDPKDPRSQGGWLWITKDLPDGKERVFEGNFCVTCHANANEQHPYGDKNPNEHFRDYVFFVPGESGAGSSQPVATPDMPGKEAGEYSSTP
jgi:hypothetical protein